MKKKTMPILEVKELLSRFDSITVVTHLNPDGDTIGTGLGIYTLLKKEGKKVEIVNASKTLPRYLDFLPSFDKIKSKIDYTKSLVITCDSANLERLGFDLQNREILNIDHHKSNVYYGTVNIVIDTYASASQVAYALFKTLYPVDKETATCFYAALLSDTRYFTTNSVNQEVFEVAKELVNIGVEPQKVAFHFTQKRSLASLRILEKALSHLELHLQGRVATLFVTQDEIKQTGALMPEMDGIVDYARSLVTVEVGVFIIELEDALRISLRSKSIDISRVANTFGGGGHKVAAGFIVKQTNLQETIDTILAKINELGILNEA